MPAMRFVIWNMSHWEKSSKDRARAWSAASELGDVGLLQETVPVPGLENCVYRPIGGTRDWGTAIVGFGVPVVEITEAKGRYNEAPVPLMSKDLTGTVVVAEVGEGSRRVTAVSMYGLINDGYADTTVHRQLSDLVPLLDSTQHGKRLLLGGDLNITTQWVGKEARYAAWERATFDRIAAFGLIDVMNKFRTAGRLEGCGCSLGENCRHIRTQYHGNSRRPWQNDYVFAAAALMPKITSVEVVDRDDLRPLSGHLPIVVTVTL
jgi:hypothetical protein